MKPWHLWSGTLAPETCDQIIANALDQPAVAATVSMGRTPTPEVRKSAVRWLSRRSPDGEWSAWEPVFKELEWLFQSANQEAFGVDLSWLPDLQFTTYDGAEEGHYDWHIDAFLEEPNSATQRKLSAVIQLTDPAEYLGGDLQIDCSPWPDAARLRQRGSVIIFPSIMRHRVTPVVRGTRHSLVAWYRGPAWR
jgi:PKHD-type hydroxylase